MADLPRPVWLLGWASLFTDAATEMIYPLLPVYLSRVLGAGAVSLGVIEGVAEGVNSILKIASGRLSDRWSRRKPVVIAGYLLSSLARPFIGVTSSWMQVLAIRVVDRTGKGIRGAPRDAMLAEFATPATRGRVYGFHRAMDHAGAVIGPLIAAAFLLGWPGQYRTLFALTIIPGALAVWMLFKVPEQAPASPESRTPSHKSQIKNQKSEIAPGLPPRLWAVLSIILVFSLGNSADAFLLLRLSSALGNDAYLPLLWSSLHVVKASLSTYGGGLSDRVGRKAVIVAGWSVYAVVYLGFATVESAAWLVAWFMLYGVVLRPRGRYGKSTRRRSGAPRSTRHGLRFLQRGARRRRAAGEHCLRPALRALRPRRRFQHRCRARGRRCCAAPPRANR